MAMIRTILMVYTDTWRCIEEVQMVMQEAVDAAKRSVDNSEPRIEELEHRIHRFIIEKKCAGD
ncbi:hypothetical protein RND71_006578 [Anisodus tanguticus]|uniref:Uncharacterized protein n=1 Tax=Anisodus tanguticus TaxID=243964 RepID=A0AAE1SU76_9SOLA|nr:hypothetical protein RND71_006578 [Anisodus tanguticus]